MASSNTAITIDDLIALLLEASAVHGGSAKVFLVNRNDDVPRLGPASIQSTVAYQEADGRTGMSFGWNHNDLQDDYVDIVRRYNDTAEAAIILF